MNPFTHAHSFETPGFYTHNVIIRHKFVRSADQSFTHKCILLTRSSVCWCSQNQG